MQINGNSNYVYMTNGETIKEVPSLNNIEEPCFVNQEEQSDIDKMYFKDELYKGLQNQFGSIMDNMFSKDELYNKFQYNSQSAKISEKAPDTRMDETIKNFSDMSDLEIMNKANEIFLSSPSELFAESSFSDLAVRLRMYAKALYAEGLSRNPEFFNGLNDNIDGFFDEIYKEIDRLRKLERASESDTAENRKNIEETVDFDEIDDEFKHLSTRITCLLGLQNSEKVLRFGRGSNGDIIFDLKRNGKTYIARYNKLEDGSERIYIDKKNGNYEELFFGNDEKLREKTVRDGNKTVQEEFFENGIKSKTVTENNHDGSTKTIKEREFPDGTVMKIEKIFHSGYADSDEKKGINLPIGKYIFVNSKGEKTGESLFETGHKSKNKENKDLKTSKINSKIDLKKS